MIKNVFIFGFGYTAKYFADLLIANNYQVYGTSRSENKRSSINDSRIQLCNFDYESVIPLLNKSQAILICISPDEDGSDLVIDNFKEILMQCKNTIKWVGYLSSTSVYGDHNGAWVTEKSECLSYDGHGEKRIIAEKKWLALYNEHSLPIHIFRLAGIYGMGRSSLDKLKEGKKYSIFKQGQYFSRIHVEDISRLLYASLQNPTPGEIYNVSDDYPSSSHEVDQYAAALLGIDKPKIISYDQANLSPMALEFYKANKRVDNNKIKKKLSLKLLYPSYKEGLKNIFDKTS